MSPQLVTVALFGSALVLMALGLPLAFVLGSCGTLFAIFLWGPHALPMISGIIFEALTSFILLAIPGFIFMAMVLERSGIGDALYDTMYAWFGPINGGLAIGTVVICAIFAAMTGLTGTATVSMGLIALPSMFSRNYNKSLTMGCISAGGALGILIPPSITFIIFGMVARVSVARLFMGGVFPGLLLASLFIIYIGIRSFMQPHIAPALPPEERVSWRKKIVTLRGVIFPAFLIIIVLGSIFSGMATPTEASVIGAVGSLICAGIARKLSWHMLKEASYRCFRLCSMIAWIIIGAKCFTAIYTGLGAPELIKEFLQMWGASRWAILIVMQLSLFILGCLLDPLGIILITVPIYAPIIVSLGFDPVWFGVLFIMNMEMAFLTPPFGFNLFYMKGVVPAGVTMGDIYRSVVPFVGLQLLGLIIVMTFPVIAMWLPTMMFTR